MDLTKQELAKKVFSACHLTGDFVLRSGLRSKEYFDKYCIESDPKLLAQVTDFMIPLIPKGITALAALEMGGLPLGTALSLKTGLPLRFVRKKAKNYGTMRLCEGGPIKGEKLCIIEDVISTGGQVIESTQQLRQLGATVEHVVCVIFRGEKAHNFNKEQLKLSYLYSKEELSHS